MRMKKMILTAVLISLFCSANSGAQNSEEYVIVALGDSITEGYGLEKSKAYPQLLQDLFVADQRKVKIVNAGISGSTTSTAPQRLKWFLKTKPDMLLLSLGANDGLRGVPVKTMRKNLETTIEMAQENKIRVVLVGMMLPPNYGKAYGKEFQDVFRQLSLKYKTDYIPFLLEGVAGDKSLNQEDGIHPNEKGQKIIAANIYKSLKTLIPTAEKKK